MPLKFLSELFSTSVSSYTTFIIHDILHTEVITTWNFFPKICPLSFILAAKIYSEILSTSFNSYTTFIIHNANHTEVIPTQRIYPQKQYSCSVFFHTTYIIHDFLHTELISTEVLSSKKLIKTFHGRKEFFSTSISS